MRPRAASVLVVVIASSAATHARAQEEAAVQAAPAAAPDAHFEIAARGGYTTNPIAGGLTPFGAGVGGRLGLILSNVYVGASVVNHFGASDDAGAAERAVLYGLELGYDVWLSGTFRLRPVLGVGGAAVFHTTPAAPASTGQPNPPDVITSASGSVGGGGSGSPTTVVNSVYLEPGILGMATLQSGAFFGVDASALVLPSVRYSEGSSMIWLSFALEAQIGQRF